MEPKIGGDNLRFSVLRKTALQCQLSHRLAETPYLATDGHTYDGPQFVSWLASSGPKSPVTGRMLTAHPLAPRNSSVLERYAQKNHFLTELSLLPASCSRTDLEALAMCPVTWDSFVDPVQVNAYTTLEREAAITLWKNNQRRPDGLRFVDATLLTPNLAARKFLKDSLGVETSKKCPLQILSNRTLDTAFARFVTLGGTVGALSLHEMVVVVLSVSLLTCLVPKVLPVDASALVSASVFFGILSLGGAAWLLVNNEFEGDPDDNYAFFFLGGLSLFLQCSALVPANAISLAQSELSQDLNVLAAACISGFGVLLGLRVFAAQGKIAVDATAENVVTTLAELSAL